VEEIEAEAFVNGAFHFRDAADHLYDLVNSRRADGLDPVYLLYFHALELAVKGCLRSQGVPTATLRSKAMGHKLKTLYDKCYTLTARLDGEARKSVEGIVSLLDQGNVNQGFRYFALVGWGMPELSWTREVAHIVVDAARAIVPECEDPNSRRAVKIDFRVSKPEPK
jgi:hypothetical protein